METPVYIAVDLGAGSGRVFLAGVSAGELWLEEARRFHYPPRRSAGHLRWDLSHIFAEIKAGLRAAAAKARELGRQIQSIGVDSWAVDYGLIDAQGTLVEDPICYRDERTKGMQDEVFKLMPRAEIFSHTGIQFLDLNTIYQIVAHLKDGISEKATRLLLIPDLINFLLTGREVAEYTNATTMQLVNHETRTWDPTIIERLALPAHLLPEIIDAGTNLGPLRPELASELGLQDVCVVAPATHDTGSAVAGAPLNDGWAYISSGTWSLVGIERNDVLINSEVARHNCTNEGGVSGTIRFLKNVMGLWVLESCRREWQAQGLATNYAALLSDVNAQSDFPALIYPDDVRLFNPPSMIDAIRTQLDETGQSIDDRPSSLAKTILDSLALRYASVSRTIEELTGDRIRGVQVVGGGSQNDYLNQATANAASKVVLAGPVESTVIGNAISQAIAAGRFKSLAEARRHVASQISLRRFEPQSSPAWTEAARRYAEIEARFTNQAV
jgi:rhamnulokinase